MSAGDAHISSSFSTRALRYCGKFLFFLLLLHGLVFCLFDLLPSAAFLRSGWAGADPTLVATTRQRMGLTGGVAERYLSSLGHLLKGDLGRTYAGEFPVAGLFRNRLATSLPIWGGAVLLCGAGVLLGGRFCTIKLDKAKHWSVFAAHLLLVPQFLAAIVVFALYVTVSPYLPSGSDSLVRVTLATFSAALLPAAMLFIATAKSAHSAAQASFVPSYLALGMDWSEVRVRLWRNIMADLRPLFGRALLAISTGTVFAETTFGINGAGKLFVDGLRASDWPVMQAWILFIGTITIGVSLTERQSA